jgi:hypothetical protein
MATSTLERDPAGRWGQESRTASPGPRAPGWALPAILALHAVTRLLILGSIVGRLDGDEAASGIQAQRILEGAFPLYFPDPYAYFGNIEQYLQAPLLALAPTNPFVLRLPQVVLSVLSCWLVALLARRCLRRPWAGELAALLFTVGPFFSLAWSIKTRTYAMALFLGLAGLVLALGTAPGARRSWLRAAAFGLVCGLAFWTNWMAAFLLLPAAFWFLGATRGGRLRLLPPAAAGFVVGALPFAITAQQGRLPTIFDRAIAESSIADRVEALFGSVLGMFLGVRRAPPAAANVPALVEPLPLVVVGALLAVLLWAVVRRWRGLLRLLTFRPGAQPGDVLLLAALLVPPLYVLSEFAFLTLEPRYVFVLYGLLPVGLAALVPRRRVAGAVVAGALVVLLAVSTLDGVRLTYAYDGAGPGTNLSLVQTEDLPAVVDALEEEGVRHAWGGYWLAHPLQFLAGDRLTVGSWEAPRFQEDYDAVQAAPSAAYLAPSGAPADDAAAALTAAGATFRTRQVGSVTMFLDVTPTVRPTRWAVNLSDAALAPAAP